MTANGILPRQAIETLIEVGALVLERPQAAGQLQSVTFNSLTGHPKALILLDFSSLVSATFGVVRTSATLNVQG